MARAQRLQQLHLPRGRATRGAAAACCCCCCGAGAGVPALALLPKCDHRPTVRVAACALCARACVQHNTARHLRRPPHDADQRHAVRGADLDEHLTQLTRRGGVDQGLRRHAARAARGEARQAGQP